MIQRTISALGPSDSAWLAVHDGNGGARMIFDRHYSRRNHPGRRRPLKFVGPGEKMVLVTQPFDALFIWRRSTIVIAEDWRATNGVYCQTFRNESLSLSSNLILDAEGWAWERWPGKMLYTYVNPKRTRSTNPGYCFKIAGWKATGHTTSRGLLVLEKYPGKGI